MLALHHEWVSEPGKSYKSTLPSGYLLLLKRPTKRTIYFSQAIPCRCANEIFSMKLFLTHLNLPAMQVADICFRVRISIRINLCSKWKESWQDEIPKPSFARFTHAKWRNFFHIFFFSLSLMKSVSFVHEECIQSMSASSWESWLRTESF